MNKFKFFAALCCTALLFAACDKNDEPKATTGTENGHDWVDLGLSVKWATCNMGADNPEAYGNYYAWGETTTKETYLWENYKYGLSSELTKYCSDSEYGKDGFTDGLITLEAADDAATSKWGGLWRMPTAEDWTELRENCTWTRTDDYNGTGVAGCIVASKTNGNSIFLPAAGYYTDTEYRHAGSYGYYWSSSLDTDSPDYAWLVYFYPERQTWTQDNRCFALPVRPVLK